MSFVGAGLADNPVVTAEELTTKPALTEFWVLNEPPRRLSKAMRDSALERQEEEEERRSLFHLCLSVVSLILIEN